MGPCLADLVVSGLGTLERPKDTWQKDLDKLDPGTVIIYNQDVKLPVESDDCVVLGMPMTKMASGCLTRGRLCSRLCSVACSTTCSLKSTSQTTRN